jgi:hypothetical protein
MARVAFKGALEATGEQGFAAAFARYMAEAPPHSALIRDVIADFAPFARADARLCADGPGYLADLLHFEEQKWRLGYALRTAIDPARVRELDFAGMPVWNPLFRVLLLRYPVHAWAGERGLAAEPCELLMYRPAGTDEVRWYKADAFFAALVQRSRDSARSSFGELIPALAAERGVAVDQTLLESLATSLTLAVERGVLLGVLDRS